MNSQLVLVLNCGSSSLKFAVISAQMVTSTYLTAECFSLEDARIKWKINGEKHQEELGANSAHDEAIQFIVNQILGRARYGTKNCRL